MNAIVSIKWLLARLYEHDQVIIDCRFQLNDPAAGFKSYEEAHIPGALYFDLAQDLSGPKSEHGGRHPLPSIEKLIEIFSRAGINDAVHVIAYDDQGGAMASRLWWLLQYLGHTKVSIMDEGFSKWKEAGFPVTSSPSPVTIPKEFIPQVQEHMLVGVEQVKQAIADPAVLLIDSREKVRYLGKQEPIDPIAGHIPGALNYDWKQNLDTDGRWLNQEQLQKRFGDLNRSQDMIVYCGSGVTACPNIIALQKAGFERVRLYAGSWSDWISYPDNPVATGEE
jgi:thiosulfate/3-mercaptopyruvate sulfurtransferase